MKPAIAISAWVKERQLPALVSQMELSIENATVAMAVANGANMQLDLFTDTGEGCSFVARPVRTNTDGKHKFDGETYEPEHDEVRLGFNYKETPDGVDKASL